MGGGKGSAPPAPDYGPLIASSTQAAQIAGQTSREQLDWAKQQYADQAPITKQYMQSMIDSSNQNIQNAKEAQARLQQTYYPIENQFAAQAQGYNDPARASQRSAAAQADVATAMGTQRQAALQSLEGYGIDPSQTRYGALDLGTRISQAAAQANAGTQSRNQSEATGLALEGEAINIGRGYPGQVAQAYGTATQAGNAGIASGLNTSSTYGNMMGSPTQWAGIQSSNLAGAGNLMNQGFQNQMAGFNANAAIAQNQASGIGSLLGAGIGAGAIII
jgi:hypothetical protein